MRFEGNSKAIEAALLAQQQLQQKVATFFRGADEGGQNRSLLLDGDGGSWGADIWGKSKDRQMRVWLGLGRRVGVGGCCCGALGSCTCLSCVANWVLHQRALIVFSSLRCDLSSLLLPPPPNAHSHRADGAVLGQLSICFIYAVKLFTANRNCAVCLWPSDVVPYRADGAVLGQLSKALAGKLLLVMHHRTCWLPCGALPWRNHKPDAGLLSPSLPLPSYTQIRTTLVLTPLVCFVLYLQGRWCCAWSAVQGSGRQGRRL